MIEGGKQFSVRSNSLVNEGLEKKTAGQYDKHNMDLNAHIQQNVLAPPKP